MIVVYPRSDYECIMARFEDDTGRATLHLHRDKNCNDPVLRQIELLSKTETVFALDVAPGERMECDL